jgi:Flp pilus assembly protein TadG
MPNFMKQRRGAIVPTFAVIFPLLMIFCAMAINLAYVQLSNTEMQIAIDASVHAGGRRLGTPVPNADGTVQTLAEAKEDVMDFAAEIAAMNTVANSAAIVPKSAMEFGRSSRTLKNDGSFGAYEFTPTNSNQIPSSFRIISNELTLNHLFGPFASRDGNSPASTFKVASTSVSTQVDRDVVLVLDRSGSMIFFEDEALLGNTLYKLSRESYTVEGEAVYEYRVQWRRPSSGITSWRDSSHGPYMTEAEFAVYPNFPSRNEYRLNYNNRRTRSEQPDEVREKITSSEYDDADQSLYRRWYTPNVIYWLEDEENPNHQLGDDPETWTDGLTTSEQRALLTGHMAQYAHDYRYIYKNNDKNIAWHQDIANRQAPAFSRWYHLNRGVTVFLNVLGGGVDPDGGVSRDGTVQKEQIAILPFNASPDNTNITFGGVNYYDNNSDFDYGLQDDGFPAAYVNNSSEPGYDEPYQGSSLSLRDILPTICPYGGTAIGNSLREGLHLIRSASSGDPDARARAFAARTLVVLTDGDNTVGSNPVTVARDELANEDIIVHTITFTPGVSQNGRKAMGDVAEFGKGKHYHTNSGTGLATIFEEIANNLPTILTQ